MGETEGWQVWQGLVELAAPLAYKVPPIRHPFPQIPALQYCPLPQTVPVVSLAQVPSTPPVLLPRQEWHAWSQVLLQQTPSGEQVVPAAQPAATVWHDCPCLLLHAPVLSQVPTHTPGSSWFFTAMHTPAEEQVRHAPAQSLRVTHPTHWLVVVSHVPAAPMQCLLAVHATQRPLVTSQARVPVRPSQSLSREHFAHRLPKQSGFCDEQSLSALHEPAASTVGPMKGASADGASAGPPVAGASGTGAGASGATYAGESGRVSTGASGEAVSGAASGSGPSGRVLNAASGGEDTESGAAASRPMAAASGTAGLSVPMAWSAVPLLSTATRPSAPPSTSRTHRQSAVHVYPVWHLSWGEQKLQSRSTQESPKIAGRRNASTLEDTETWLLISEVFGYGFGKLLGKWPKQWRVPWLSSGTVPPSRAAFGCPLLSTIAGRKTTRQTMPTRAWRVKWRASGLGSRKRTAAGRPQVASRSRVRCGRSCRCQIPRTKCYRLVRLRCRQAGRLRS